MKKWTMTVTVEVADSWVADGFDLKTRIEEMQEKLYSMLPYAGEHEMVVGIRITSAPPETQIAGLQNGDIATED